ncbi:hypothetical protein [Micromonospora globbae]|uniref:hypothetical protein n=1 Tax=Micromonospora globbae TaxID=1894969 RepID=UPI00379AAC7B
MATAEVPPPEEPVLQEDDPKTILQQRLRTVLLGLPSFFKFSNHISGVNATDLYSLNGLLGASIEGQVVKALNQQRALWDPDDEWLGYTFERQSQAFPDVRLVRKGASTDGIEIALGIELKGWFLLSKEGEPSFRFTTTAAACADHDLLVVVPWYLDNVLSGSPVAGEPFVASAKWAAEYRNYYWQHVRRTNASTDIASPSGAKPYPAKADLIADVPAVDGGKNFGRVARAEGLMTDWIRTTNQTEVLGIRIEDWFLFLKMHSDQADPSDITLKLYEEVLRAKDGQAKRQAVKAYQSLMGLLDAYGVDG